MTIQPGLFDFQPPLGLSNLRIPLVDMPPHNHVDTSIASAQKLAPRVSAQRLRVLRFIANSSDGATCDEVEIALGLTHQSASSRLWELEGNGNRERFVFKSDDKRTTRHGNKARVYRVVPGADIPTDADAGIEANDATQTC